MKERVVTALCLIPPVLAALFLASPWPIAILGLVAVCIGAWEIGRMLDSKLAVPGAVFFTLAALWILGGVAPSKTASTGFVFLWASGIVFTWIQVLTKGSGAAKVGTLGSAGWVVGPIFSLLCLHNVQPGTAGVWNFSTPVLLAMVPLWGGDTAAIFAGRAFGKHPLAPKISPKKTWEGAIANLLACILVAAGLAVLIGYSAGIGTACGFAAGIFGQAGDLFESYVKRAAGLKDSGTLLPGHGGLMDRIDSILFTAPVVALILTLT